MTKKFFYLVTMRGDYKLILNRLRAEGCKVLVFKAVSHPRHAHAVIYANHLIDYSLCRELAKFSCYVHFKYLRNQADIRDAIQYVRYNEEFHAPRGGDSVSSVDERLDKLEKTVSELAKAVEKLLDKKESERKRVIASGQRLEIASMTFAIKESRYEGKVLLVVTAGKKNICRPLSYSELKQIAEFFANLEIEESANNSKKKAKSSKKVRKKKFSEAAED